jgi:hypothetical protein
VLRHTGDPGSTSQRAPKAVRKEPLNRSPGSLDRFGVPVHRSQNTGTEVMHLAIVRVQPNSTLGFEIGVGEVPARYKYSGH